MNMLARVEPLNVPEGDPELGDLVFELLQKSSALAGQLSKEVRVELGRLVRSMNCYYSNLIEGHFTHPRSIERALANDLVTEPKQHNLQLEALAHIEVQRKIDSGMDPQDWPTSVSYVRWIHAEFCARLPDPLLEQRNDKGELVVVVPGEFRNEHVVVGHHVAPPPDELADLMARFEAAYDPARLSRIELLIASAASHHRLLWIHPFLDGNGRVARLMSHALLLRLGVGSGLWSVSRGLARRVEEYKAVLTFADAPRRNDLDGRGTLSLEGLKAFCKFFLEVCIDQVDFMHSLLQPTELLRRMEIYVTDEVQAKRLPKGSFEMLREVYFHGAVPRGRAPEITGYEERRARETVSVLLEKGLLSSTGPRAPVSLGFPVEVQERWLPALYPVGVSAA